MPVYGALSDYLTSLTPTLYPGVHQETSWQLVYTGVWDTMLDDHAVLGSYRTTSDPEASVALTWEGRTLTLIPGPGQGVVRVKDAQGRSRDLSLDGNPVTLHRALHVTPRRITLTRIAGDFTLDALHIRR